MTTTTREEPGSGTSPLSQLSVGDQLPPLELPPLSRTTIALYAAGSGDHMPLHIDSDFARQAGYPDVFMHGALGMAYIGRMLTQSVPQASIREMKFRFSAITYPGERLVCRGEVLERTGAAVRVGFSLVNSDGETKLSGEAVLG